MTKSTFNKIIVALGSFLVIGAAQARPTIVFIGDSITANWSTIGTVFPGANTVNAGIGRQTSAQMLARFEGDVLSRNPQTVYIEAGTNDIYFGIPIIETKINFTAMIALARAHGVDVVLCSVLPTDAPNAAFRPPEQIAALNAWLRATAMADGLKYIDYHAQFIGRSGLTLDGVHPNAAGYAVMAAALQNSADAD